MIDHKVDNSAVKSIDKNQWIKEAMELRPQIYATEDKEYLSYEYLYINWPTVKEQLYKGGVRLAMVLNEAFE